MNTPGAILDVRDAVKTYAPDGGIVAALRGVTLRVDRGEFVAIMGPSGSGKSTLLHLMGGIDFPSAGDVVLFGHSTHGMTDAALSALRLRRIGFIFQRFFLLPMLDVGENVVLPMLEAGVGPSERAARVGEVLAYVGLDHRRRHLPGQLSGGELQRAAIARALVNRPDLVLADEPTGELDQDTGREIGRLLQRINAEGVAVVVVTHNPDLAAPAGRVLTMRDGRLA